MFTIEEREAIRDQIVENARADEQVTGGALIGSIARGVDDRWSDIDITFGVVEGSSLTGILDAWMAELDATFGVVDHFDLPAGPSIYRVLLFRNGLEADVSVTPESAFGARGPAFQMLFGESRKVEAPPSPDPHFLAGMTWHHLLHARTSIRRGDRWRAEYWLSAARDHVLELACIRLGFPAVHGRGFSRLPESVTRPLESGIVRSLEPAELRRALDIVVERYLVELREIDPDREARLRPVLQDDGIPD